MLRHGKAFTVFRQLCKFKKKTMQMKYFTRNAHETNSTWAQPIGLDTGIKTYNCVARTTVPLVFTNEHIATWYTCGPTVYDSAHIGHASCYVKLDIIQRILRDQFNVNLVTAMNITDIDDKIIKKSIETQEPWLQLAKRFEAEFWKDMDSLNVCRPDIILRVSERVPEIITFVQRLLDQKAAYVANDGSVYFDNKRTTGKLQNIGSQETYPVLLTIKKSARDFALWKASKPGEPSWDVSWTCNEGAPTHGRPGWHTECAAMASSTFGDTIDIHGGGMDLRFPHHENEENQSCTYHNCQQWVNYWLHVGQLHLDEENKMSKSLKNTISIAVLLEKYTSNQFRMACLLSNYGNKMYYSDDSMAIACNVWNRITTFIQESTGFVQNSSITNNNRYVDRLGILRKLDETKHLVDGALKDDFSTSKGVEYLLHLISYVNKSLTNSSTDSNNTRIEITNADVLQLTQNYIVKQLEIFGCEIRSRSNSTAANQLVVQEELINDIVSFRDSLRNQAFLNKDKNLFEICSKIREIFGNNNVEIKDEALKTGQIVKSRWTVKSCKKNTSKDSIRNEQ